MRVKIVKGESTKEVENELNNFLSDRKDINVIDIREVDSTRSFIFMIMYEHKVDTN